MAEGGEIKDLFSLIEESSVECLNQDAAHTVEHCFKQVSAWLDFSFHGQSRAHGAATPTSRGPRARAPVHALWPPANLLSYSQGPRDDDAVFLASDCDEQLLINLKFKQSVRLHSIAIKSLDADKAPKKIKLFVNPVNMSFDSAVRLPVRDFALPRAAGRQRACRLFWLSSACV